MNNTTSRKITVAIAVMIAISAAIPSVTAHETIFQYGTIAQEDQDFAVHDGAVYLNAVYEDNSGNFRYAMPAEFTVDQAIERFNINEDQNSFTVYKDWNNLGMTFMFNDETLTFQFIGVVQ